MADKNKDEDKIEIPKPHKEIKLIQQMYNQSMEEPYFWFINWFKDDLRNDLLVTPDEDPYEYLNRSIVKLNDIFAASESSSYFGNQSQRLGIQQDKASQFLGVIGRMIKEIFQMVREMRILDERLQLYNETLQEGGDSLSAEISLKGMYVDLVEGGSKNPSSVYGLASQVGFVTLPDLFFRVLVKKGESVGDTVERDYGQFNEKVKEVLKRKLKQYYIWKERTHLELKTRRRFVLSYLKQHNQIINMYMAWVRPYLRQIERLTMHDFSAGAELIAGMEQAILEIEILVKFSTQKTGKYIPCMHIHFLYRTSPQMAYTQEYQKGPAHMGRLEMTFKAVTLTEEDIKNIKKEREKKDLEMLGKVDSSVKEALEAMGEELKDYLEEAELPSEKKAREEKEAKDKEKEKNKEKKTFRGMLYKTMVGNERADVGRSGSMIGPFVELFKGVAQMTDALTGVSRWVKPKEGKKGEDVYTIQGQKSAAKKSAIGKLTLSVKVFKKSHKMIAY